MADNSYSTVLLICVVCGMKYQAVATAVGRKCICGGALKKVERKEPGK